MNRGNPAEVVCYYLARTLFHFFKWEAVVLNSAGVSPWMVALTI